MNVNNVPIHERRYGDLVCYFYDRISEDGSTTTTPLLHLSGDFYIPPCSEQEILAFTELMLAVAQDCFLETVSCERSVHRGRVADKPDRMQSSVWVKVLFDEVPDWEDVIESLKSEIDDIKASIAAHRARDH